MRSGAKQMPVMTGNVEPRVGSCFIEESKRSNLHFSHTRGMGALHEICLGPKDNDEFSVGAKRNPL